MESFCQLQEVKRAIFFHGGAHFFKWVHIFTWVHIFMWVHIFSRGCTFFTRVYIFFTWVYTTKRASLPPTNLKFGFHLPRLLPGKTNKDLRWSLIKWKYGSLQHQNSESEGKEVEDKIDDIRNMKKHSVILSFVFLKINYILKFLFLSQHKFLAKLRVRSLVENCFWKLNQFWPMKVAGCTHPTRTNFSRIVQNPNY